MLSRASHRATCPSKSTTSCPRSACRGTTGCCSSTSPHSFPQTYERSCASRGGIWRRHIESYWNFEGHNILFLSLTEICLPLPTPQFVSSFQMSTVRNPFGLPSDISPLPMLKLLQEMGVTPSSDILLGRSYHHGGDDGNGGTSSSESLASSYSGSSTSGGSSSSNNSDEDNSEHDDDSRSSRNSSTDKTPPPTTGVSFKDCHVDASSDTTTGPEAGMYLAALSADRRADLMKRICSAATARLTSGAARLSEMYDFVVTQGKRPPVWARRKILLEAREITPGHTSNIVGRSALDTVTFVHATTSSFVTSAFYTRTSAMSSLQTWRDAARAEGTLELWECVVSHVQAVRASGAPSSSEVSAVLDLMAGLMTISVPTAYRASARNATLKFL
eukprot:PhM_4_TR16353/c0_g1_i1/m.81804